jgi:tetratricopeptide (TPR) repeat protein
MRYLKFFIPIVLMSFQTTAQSVHKLKRIAEDQYDHGLYTEAEENYRKANAIEKEAQTSFNLGNSIYNQERYEEAVRQYEQTIERTSDKIDKANAYYNLGNAHFNNQAYDKSVDAYKESLKINPADLDTKKNLTMALRQLQLQEQQQKQQQEQEQQQEQDEKEENEEQQQQNQQQQEQQQDSEEQQPEPSRDLSREEAEELLRIIESEDQKVQQKLRKAASGSKKNEKDW